MVADINSEQIIHAERIGLQKLVLEQHTQYA